MATLYQLNQNTVLPCWLHLYSLNNFYTHIQNIVSQRNLQACRNLGISHDGIRHEYVMEYAMMELQQRAEIHTDVHIHTYMHTYIHT